MPPGYRLVAVHADAVSAVGNLIQPGDRVDVLVYLKSFKAARRPAQRRSCKTSKCSPSTINGGRAKTRAATRSRLKNVTLLVTPEQAEKLTLATELGKVKLVLRSPDDNLKTEQQRRHDAAGSVRRAPTATRTKLARGNSKPASRRAGSVCGMLGLGKNHRSCNGTAHAGPMSPELRTVHDGVDRRSGSCGPSSSRK